MKIISQQPGWNDDGKMPGAAVCVPDECLAVTQVE